MNSKSMTFSLVQNRSNLPNVFSMSNHPTAEKSVQTHDSSNASSLINTHPETAAAEVANTLVSMATGQQRTTLNNVKQLNVISVPNTSTSLPAISLTDYGAVRGVPTAITLTNPASITLRSTDETTTRSMDDTMMSTDQSNDTITSSTSSANKTRRTKTKKSSSTGKVSKEVPVEPIQYGPIVVKPRKHVAPTLANGRRSKDDPLPPEEEMKRKLRRDRNKLAAAKCRRKRNDLREELEKTEQMLLDQQKALELSVQNLTEQKNQLECLFYRHPCNRKSSLPINRTELKNIPNNTTTFVDGATHPISTKRVTINFSNPQDLLAVAAPLARSNSSSETVNSNPNAVPIITIHIVPEVAQALLGSTTFDRAKLVELLQQTNMNNLSATLENPSTNRNS